ncbi:MAG TPA: Ig-like domain repeat protein [Acidimicrobiales bacterium]|nr:Ig-like domain repeat protein [Acidimicrobiales bacterium]
MSISLPLRFRTKSRPWSLFGTIILGFIIILGLGAIAEAYLSSQGTGTGSVRVALTNLDRITITPTLSTVVTGQPVTYTVKAFDNFDNSTDVTAASTLTITNGTCVPVTASCTSNAVGSQTVTATYQGKTANATQIVNQAATATTVLSSANPSVVGQTVGYTATVAVTSPGTGTPTGFVEFLDGATPIVGCGGSSGSALTGLSATCSVSYTSPASHVITATYLGDTNFLASSPSAPLTQIVNQAATATGLTTDLSTYVSGETIVVTATVAPVAPGSGTPTGTVSVSDGGSPAKTCVITLSSGTTCTIVETAPGNYTFAGTYGGDANFLGSSGSAAAVVVVADGTTTVVTDNASSPVTGATFTFTATVSALGPGTGTPGGTIVWNVTDPNANPLTCSDTTLVSGTATCTITGALAGTYHASASFTDTVGNFTDSSSNTDKVVVGSTTFTLTYQGGSATSGTAPSDPSSPYASGTAVTVLGNTGDLAEAGFTFGGWNTQSNGLGTSYAPGATFSISANTVLYAVFSAIAPPTTFTQIAPFSGTTTTGDSSSFSIQLNVTGNTGAVTFTTTGGHTSDGDGDHDPGHLKVSSSGVLTVADGPLEAGTYTVSGTMKDAAVDNGTWTYTFTVIASTITQIAPFSGKTTFHDSARFSTQVNVTGATGAVTFMTTSVSSSDEDNDHDSAHVKVSDSGVVTVADGPLEAGTYTVSGTMKDAAGDTGTWTYTLTVKGDGRGEKHV